LGGHWPWSVGLTKGEALAELKEHVNHIERKHPGPWTYREKPQAYQVTPREKEWNIRLKDYLLVHKGREVPEVLWVGYCWIHT